jgi:hypothetical protein
MQHKNRSMVKANAVVLDASLMGFTSGSHWKRGEFIDWDEARFNGCLEHIHLVGLQLLIKSQLLHQQRTFSGSTHDESGYRPDDEAQADDKIGQPRRSRVFSHDSDGRSKFTVIVGPTVTVVVYASL